MFSFSNSRKIRIVHYCNQLSLGGTERSMEIFCKHLNKSQFEVYVVSRIYQKPLLEKLRVYGAACLQMGSAKAKKKLWQQMNARVPCFQKILGEDRVLFAKDDLHLRHLLFKISPDILHVWYSGQPEPPTSDEILMKRVPITVTTNSFEIENTAPAHKLVKRMHFLSHWLLEKKALWAKDDPRSAVLYPPIEMPVTHEDLRLELKLPKNAFIVGRVGRPDSGIHDPISLNAFQKIEDPLTYFLALAPPENMIKQAQQLHLKNFIALPPTTDELMLSKFYNTIDILAHARRDGETFGCNIAEAMMHAKPVVSHFSEFMNAQLEVIDEAGFVCPQDDWKEYADRLLFLKTRPEVRKELSGRAVKRAQTNFEAGMLTRQLEEDYLSLVSRAMN